MNPFFTQFEIFLIVSFHKKSPVVYEREVREVAGLFKTSLFTAFLSQKTRGLKKLTFFGFFLIFLLKWIRFKKQKLATKL